MRRLTVTGLIALAILVGFARPASAQWSFLKWLEELSGPGPFHMNGLDAGFYCPNAHARARLTDSHSDFRLFCDKEVGLFRDVKFYVGFSFLTGSGNNPLTYAGQPDDSNRSVSAQSYAAIVGYRVSRWADVATQVGAVHFSAEGTGTDKFFFDPYVAVRPLAALNGPIKDRFRDFVQVRFGVLLFPQGFTLADFGASGGPLTGKAEAVWHLGVLVDITSFLPFNR